MCSSDLVVRKVQDARKAADLHVADRISLLLEVPHDNEAALRGHADLIARETLAHQLEIRAHDNGDIAVHLTKTDNPEGTR